jgi:hypothetical protein
MQFRWPAVIAQLSCTFSDCRQISLVVIVFQFSNHTTKIEPFLPRRPFVFTLLCMADTFQNGAGLHFTMANIDININQYFMIIATL